MVTALGLVLMIGRFPDPAASGAIGKVLGGVCRNQSKGVFSGCVAAQVQECEDNWSLFFVSPFHSFDTDF
jgi:hypothetical protein